MRKIILSVLAFGAFTFANAQDANGGFSKGSTFLSGSLEFNSGKYTNGNYKENGFTFAPKVGHFVTENIALGLGLTYSSFTAEEYEGADKDKYSAVGIEAFGRYYWTPANQFSFFGQASIGYVSVDYDAYKVNGFGIGIAPGISYFLSNKLAVEATWGILSYTTAKPDFAGAESSTSFDLGINLDNINLGIIYKF